MQNEFFFFGKNQFYYILPFENHERRFELPLLKYFIDKFQGNEDLMEIGAVSHYHFPVHHKIYDATETGVINAFAEDLKYTDKIVLSISTIEHIGRGDYGLPYYPYRAITVLNMMLEAKYFLITWPIGYNTLLDYYARNIVPGMNPNIIKTAHRLDKDNNWKVNNPNYFDYLYNSPWPYGNGVFVLTNLEELL